MLDLGDSCTLNSVATFVSQSMSNVMHDAGLGADGSPALVQVVCLVLSARYHRMVSALSCSITCIVDPFIGALSAKHMLT